MTEYDDEILWAMRTRVLTDKEMAYVRQRDYYILLRNGRSFRESEMRTAFNELLLLQYQIRDIANRGVRMVDAPQE